MKSGKGAALPLYEITVIHRFDAGHRLPCPGEGWEQLHDHAWRVEATARCRGVDEAGMALDFRFFKAILKEVLGRLDGRCLNETPPFNTLPPSAENVAHYVFSMMEKRLGQRAYLQRITVWESDDCSAAFLGENE
jgi:6-pyruvoyltetrahydropterin/6-carboxytetrahydropterin synthase